jgi:hypothetical protein
MLRLAREYIQCQSWLKHRNSEAVASSKYRQLTWEYQEALEEGRPNAAALTMRQMNNLIKNAEQPLRKALNQIEIRSGGNLDELQSLVEVLENNPLLLVSGEKS